MLNKYSQLLFFVLSLAIRISYYTSAVNVLTNNQSTIENTSTTTEYLINTEIIYPKFNETLNPVTELEQNNSKNSEPHNYYPINFDFNLDDLEDIHENLKVIEFNMDKNVDHMTDLTLINKQHLNDTFDENTKRNITIQQVYKIPPKVNKSKTKSRDLLRKNNSHKSPTNQFNSINNPKNQQEILNSIEEYHFQPSFQIFVNLFDHFYWQPSELKIRLTIPCGIQLQSYLSGLNNNYLWAQNAYDCSGHYRGQFFYGNNFWIGEKMFCDHLNHKINQIDGFYFEFGFFVAHVKLHSFPDINSTNILQVGECLPKICTTTDVQKILEYDPHVRMYNSIKIHNSTIGNSSNILQILSVRKVPGDYIIWKDLRFQIFCGLCLILTVIMIAATIYESLILPNINEHNSNTNKNKYNKKSERQLTNGKSFELYQINPSENNNIEIETITTNPEKSTNSQFMTTCNDIDSKNINKIKTNTLESTFLCFSLTTNAKTIVSIKKPQEERLSCIHGIRVFSVLWTILVHTYLQMFAVGENRYRRTISEQSFLFQIIGNATFSVDSFFFISGLLITILFLKQYKKNNDNFHIYIKKGCLKTIIMIIYRYIRLTPAYAFVLYFNQISLQYVFNKSVFTSTVNDDITCANYWWRNLLYINNWYPFKEICMIWSWYLANDMQFYIMAIILLIISKRYPKLSKFIICGILLSSWVTSGLFSLSYNYTHKVAAPFESFDFLYDKPWQRVGTFLIGMIGGYIIHNQKTIPSIPFGIKLFFWIISVGLLFILVFGVWHHQLGILSTAFYVSVGHTAWGCALMWIVLSCYWGLTPSVNKFLSFRGFLPLSRLTYCTYLIHPVIMIITSFYMDGPSHLEHVMIITVFLGNTVISFFSAFIISITFEAPVIRLLKILISK